MSKKIILSLYLSNIYSDEFYAYTQAFEAYKEILFTYAQCIKVLSYFEFL